MIGKANQFGQVNFMPGSRESTANVWNVRIPGNPIGMTYGVPGGRDLGIAGECLDEWFALQRKMKGRMGARGGGRVSPGLVAFPVMPTGKWLARCVARKTPIGYSGSYGVCEDCNGYGDAMDGAIIDQRPLAMLRKPHTMAGVTLPMWGWALGGILLYRIVRR